MNSNRKPKNRDRRRFAAGGMLVVFAILIVGNVVRAETGGARTEIYFVTSVGAVAPGGELTVAVLLSAAAPVNAVVFEIGYSGQLMDFVRTDTGASLIDVWRKPPEVLRDGIVRIEGGMTHPYVGRAGELVKLTFRVHADAAGSVQWSVRSGQVAQANGRGTIADLATAPASVAIVPGSPPSGPTGNPDADPPRLGTVTTVRNPIDRSYLGVWSATDAGSGIAESEVRFRRWLTWSSWTTRENPVQMPAGAWAMGVRVTDNAGNASEGSVVRWDILLVKLGTLVALILLAIHVIRWEIAHHPRRRPR